MNNIIYINSTLLYFKQTDLINFNDFMISNNSLSSSSLVHSVKNNQIAFQKFIILQNIFDFSFLFNFQNHEIKEKIAYFEDFTLIENSFIGDSCFLHFLLPLDWLERKTIFKPM